MKLILCAGNRQRQGWVHHDIQSLNGIDIVCDLRKIRRLLSDSSCENIELTHALEHFPTKEIPKILKDIYSLLKIGGELYMEIPNFAWHAKLIREEKDDEQAVAYAFGGQLDKYDFHKTGFTKSIIKKRLKEAGFKEIKIDPKHSLIITCKK